MVLVAVTLALRLAVLPVEAGLAYSIFFPGLAVTVFLCGVGPGLLFVALAAPASAFIFIAPYWNFKELSLVLPRMGFFVASALAILEVIYYFQRKAAQQQRRLQDEITQNLLLKSAGERQQVLIDSIDDDDGIARARSFESAPEIDGLILIQDPPSALAKGDNVEVEIIDVSGVDRNAKISLS